MNPPTIKKTHAKAMPNGDMEISVETEDELYGPFVIPVGKPLPEVARVLRAIAYVFVAGSNMHVEDMRRIGPRPRGRPRGASAGA